jgi:hypothetical protein
MAFGIHTTKTAGKSHYVPVRSIGVTTLSHPIALLAFPHYGAHNAVMLRSILEFMRRARGLTVLLLAVAVLAPYARMLAGRDIPVPDDVFVSDLADAEFPVRVEAARLVRAGELPVWTPRLFTGAPLQVDPLSIALFTALPPALALGWLIGLLLVTATGGAYLLARRLGCSRTGAFLAGFAYAWSGFFVCQLRHLGVLGTVAFFPLALVCLEMAATGGAADRRQARAVPVRRRFAWLLGFAAVFGLQCLAAFPQSAYISALVYAALVAARLLWLLAPDDRTLTLGQRAKPSAALALGALAAVAIGLLLGMATLLPLHELGSLSDRGGGGTYEWATRFNYWPRNILTFVSPYSNGDISDLSYRGSSIFWEDYGYVGFATLLLALLAVMARFRRFAVAFWLLTGLTAYGLVLGREAPLYRLAFDALPGFSLFRFPSRFLFVVELALALLGGIGLTALEQFMARHTANAPRRRLLPALAAALLVGLTVADLIYHNRRQNPFADARTWLAAPHTAEIIRSDGTDGRVFSPGSSLLHMAVFTAAHGWSGNLQPYLAHREFLQPDSNLLHGLATVDGYAGIAPRWTVDLIGDHNRQGILGRLYGMDKDGFRAADAFFDWMEALSVRWVILPFRVSSDRMQRVGSAPPGEVYRLPGALPRARVVARARMAPSMEELWRLITAGRIDPRREVVLQDPSDEPFVRSLTGKALDGSPDGDARIVVDRSTEVVVEATAPRGGLLLLADTFYPGWEATVDGHPARILRANIAHRAVVLSPGAHHVTFRFHSRSVTRGLLLSGLGLFLLLLGILRLGSRPSPAGS